MIPERPVRVEEEQARRVGHSKPECNCRQESWWGWLQPFSCRATLECKLHLRVVPIGAGHWLSCPKLSNHWSIATGIMVGRGRRKNSVFCVSVQSGSSNLRTAVGISTAFPGCWKHCGVNRVLRNGNVYTYIWRVMSRTQHLWSWLLLFLDLLMINYINRFSKDCMLFS